MRDVRVHWKASVEGLAGSMRILGILYKDSRKGSTCRGWRWNDKPTVVELLVLGFT